MANTDFRAVQNLDLSRNRLLAAGLEELLALPTGPINGQVAFNKITGDPWIDHAYVYVSAIPAWVPLGGLTVNETVKGTWNFNPASGPPFSVGNTTKVTNLNADLLDGADTAIANNANTICLRDSGGRTQVSTPVLPADAVNKQYADTLVSGNHPMSGGPARAATTAALAAGYNGATDTLTAQSNVVLPAIDGITLVVNDRVLVKDQSGASQYQNGVYQVTNVGVAGSAPWILTRTPDANEAAELTVGATVTVTLGTVNKGSKFRQINSVANVDTDAENWVLDSVTDLLAGPGIIVEGAKISFQNSTGYGNSSLFYSFDTGTPPVQSIKELAFVANKVLLSDSTKPYWGTMDWLTSLPSLEIAVTTPLSITATRDPTGAGGPVTASGAIAQLGAEALKWTISIDSSYLVSFAPPTRLVTLSAVTGTLGTVLHSDVGLALDQAIAPTWSAKHVFSAGLATKALHSSTVYIATFSADTHTSAGDLGSITLAALGTALNVPTPSAPTALVGLTSVSGTLTAGTPYLAYNSAPALSQAIVPTWTGTHTWFYSGTPTVLLMVKNQVAGQPAWSVDSSGANFFGDGIEVPDVKYYRGAGGRFQIDPVGSATVSELSVDSLTSKAAAVASGAAINSVAVWDADPVTGRRTLKSSDKTKFATWLGPTQATLATDAIGYGVGGVLSGNPVNLFFNGTQIRVQTGTISIPSLAFIGTAADNKLGFYNRTATFPGIAFVSNDLNRLTVGANIAVNVPIVVEADNSYDIGATGTEHRAIYSRTGDHANLNLASTAGSTLSVMTGFDAALSSTRQPLKGYTAAQVRGFLGFQPSTVVGSGIPNRFAFWKSASVLDNAPMFVDDVNSLTNSMQHFVPDSDIEWDLGFGGVGSDVGPELIVGNNQTFAAAGNWTAVGPTTTLLLTGGRMQITYTSGAQAWGMELGAVAALTVEANTRYKITFKAKIDGTVPPWPVVVTVRDFNGNLTFPSGATWNLTGTDQTVTIIAEATNASSATRLQLVEASLQGFVSTISFDDVHMQKIVAGAAVAARRWRKLWVADVDASVLVASANLSVAGTDAATATTQPAVVLGLDNVISATRQTVKGYKAVPSGFVTLTSKAIGYGSVTNQLTGDAARLNWDHQNFRLGVMVTSPSYPVDIFGTTRVSNTITAVTADGQATTPGLYLVISDACANNADWTNRSCFGSYMQLTKSGAATFATYSAIAGARINVAVINGSSDILMGTSTIVGCGHTVNTPNVNFIYGHYCSMSTSSGATGTLGTIGQANLFYAGDNLPIATIGEIYGFRAAGFSTSGTTRTAGIRTTITSGANRFNLYLDGAAVNYIAAPTGFGTNLTAPVAWVEMAVGSTTVSPLKFSGSSTSATLLTTPLAGAVESTGDRLWFTNTTPVRRGLAFYDDIDFTNDVAASDAGRIRPSSASAGKHWAESFTSGGSIGTGDYTFHIRLRWPSTNAPADAGIWNLTGAVNDGAAARDIGAVVGSGTTNLVFYYRDDSVVLAPSSAIAMTKWLGKVIDIVVTRAASSENVYINGEIQTYTRSTQSGANINHDPMKIRVGNIHSSALPYYEEIYRVRLFNRALSAAQVIELSRTGVRYSDRWATMGSSVGCIFDLDFGGAGGTYVPDISLRYPATLYGTIAISSGHAHAITDVASQQVNGVAYVGSNARLTADATKMSWTGSRFNVYGDSYIQNGLGVGIAPSTASWLELAAGTATKAPLRMGVGSFLTTPVSGSFENDGTRPYYTTSAPVRRPLAFYDETNYTNDPTGNPGGGVAFDSNTRMVAPLDQTNLIGQGDFTLWSRFRMWPAFHGPQAEGVVAVGAPTDPTNLNSVTTYTLSARIVISSGGQIYFYLTTDGSNYRLLRSPAGMFTLYGGKIIDVAIVRAGAATPIMYINGAAVATTESLVNPGGTAPAWDGIVSSKYFMAGLDYYGFGSVPEIYRGALFNYAMSATDAANLSKNGRVDTQDKWGWLTARTITNPGFEGTFTAGVPAGWIKGAYITLADEPTDKNSGSHSVRLTGAGSAGSTGGNWLYQTGLLAPEKRYMAFAYAKRVSGTGALTLGCAYSQGGIMGNLAGSISSAASWTQFGGMFKSDDGSAGSQTDRICFASNPAGDVWLIDDVTLFQVGAIVDYDFGVGCGNLVPDRSGRYPGTLYGNYEHIVNRCPMDIASGSGFLSYGIRRFVQRGVALGTGTVGNASGIPIVHNLNTRDVTTTVWHDNITPVSRIELGVTIDDVNTVRVWPSTIPNTPSSATATVVIVG